jgi:hypothetical protein
MAGAAATYRSGMRSWAVTYRAGSCGAGGVGELREENRLHRGRVSVPLFYRGGAIRVAERLACGDDNI